MDNQVKELINTTVLKMIQQTQTPAKIKEFQNRHNVKIHFVPKRYRIFGGMLQALNIKFGNFIEELMATFVQNETNYEILSEFSQKKQNVFELSTRNDARIDAYISKCQYENVDIQTEFPKLLQEIVEDQCQETKTFNHDIDLLFKNRETETVYYLEMKYNDDHDTGKFVDINRKFIKTYAYLAKKLEITDSTKLVPILFFFTNKKMKGNIYVPEETNIRRGQGFFEDFLSVSYQDVDTYLNTLSESDDVVHMFHDLYEKVMALN